MQIITSMYKSPAKIFRNVFLFYGLRQTKARRQALLIIVRINLLYNDDI